MDGMQVMFVFLLQLQTCGSDNPNKMRKSKTRDYIRSIIKREKGKTVDFNMRTLCG